MFWFAKQRATSKKQNLYYSNQQIVRYLAYCGVYPVGFKSVFLRRSKYFALVVVRVNSLQIFIRFLVFNQYPYWEPHTFDCKSQHGVFGPQVKVIGEKQREFGSILFENRTHNNNHVIFIQIPSECQHIFLNFYAIWETTKTASWYAQHFLIENNFFIKVKPFVGVSEIT